MASISKRAASISARATRVASSEPSRSERHASARATTPNASLPPPPPPRKPPFAPAPPPPRWPPPPRAPKRASLKRRRRLRTLALGGRFHRLGVALDARAPSQVPRGASLLGLRTGARGALRPARRARALTASSLRVSACVAFATRASSVDFSSSNALTRRRNASDSSRTLADSNALFSSRCRAPPPSRVRGPRTGAARSGSSASCRACSRSCFKASRAARLSSRSKRTRRPTAKHLLLRLRRLSRLRATSLAPRGAAFSPAATEARRAASSVSLSRRSCARSRAAFSVVLDLAHQVRGGFFPAAPPPRRPPPRRARDAAPPARGASSPESRARVGNRSSKSATRAARHLLFLFQPRGVRSRVRSSSARRHERGASTDARARTRARARLGGCARRAIRLPAPRAPRASSDSRARSAAAAARARGARLEPSLVRGDAAKDARFASASSSSLRARAERDSLVAAAPGARAVASPRRLVSRANASRRRRGPRGVRSSERWRRRIATRRSSNTSWSSEHRLAVLGVFGAARRATALARAQPPRAADAPAAARDALGSRSAR